jgi:PAS domain S-box-containing protein
MYIEAGLADPGNSFGSESLQSFIENSPVGIHSVDEEGIIAFANKAELNLLGYAEREYVGQPLKKFFHDPVFFDELYSRLRKEGFLKNEQAKMVCGDGSLKEVMISCNYYSEGKKLVHSRCFTRDITEIKRSEKLLVLLNRAGEELAGTRNTDEALSKIIKFLIPSFTDWVVINELGIDGKAHLLKMAHSDPARMRWAEEYRKKHPIIVDNNDKNLVAYVLKSGKPKLIPEVTEKILNDAGVDREYKRILKDLAVTSVMIVPMKVKQTVTGVVSFFSCNPNNTYDEKDFNFAKDFCNRIAVALDNARLYEEVRRDIEQKTEANNKKDEFISIASHELKTPVTSLKAYTQILQSTFADEKIPGAAEMLAKMDRQIDKLTLLIVEMLDVTKIDKGELIYDDEKFDFNEMVKEVAEEMQRITKSHQIVLNLSDCDPIKGDRNRIGQVLVNFISNAIKYSPGGDKITISTSCADNKVKLSVKDEGIGIPDDDQPGIFKRFFRVSAKNSYTFPGMGLGLYISSEIIKRHHGRIFFESKEGEGSVFSFEIDSNI